MEDKIPMYLVILDKIDGIVEHIARDEDTKYECRLSEWGEVIVKSELTKNQQLLISERLNRLVSRLWNDDPRVDERIKRTRDFLKSLAKIIS